MFFNYTGYGITIFVGMEDIIYNAVKNASHLTVYKKEDIPLDYHYANTSGVMPLQFVADIHWRLAHYYSGKNDAMKNFITVRGKKLQLPDPQLTNYTGQKLLYLLFYHFFVFLHFVLLLIMVKNIFFCFSWRTR